MSYTINSTGGDSNKYGKCQICDKHASEVFMRTRYENEWSHALNKEVAFRYESTFGHKECLSNDKGE